MAKTQAYRQEVLYPRYLFLFYGWYNDQWWIGSKNENLSCTAEQRKRVISSGLAPLQDELISDCLKYADTGIVSLCYKTYHIANNEYYRVIDYQASRGNFSSVLMGLFSCLIS